MGNEPKYRLVGSSAVLCQLVQEIETLGPQEKVDVYIHGETGVGKELVARALHDSSPRRGKPFIARNCAAIAETLLEAEVFGQMKGGYTGAEAKAGLVKQAEGGTLFLDEIGELPMQLQAKMLRLFENREYCPVGGQLSTTDARIVTATNKNLEAEMKARHFRVDLYHRLGQEIYVPPLRDRREDIPALVRHYFDDFRAKMTSQPKDDLYLSDRAMQMMQKEYDWPGNVRELKTYLEGLLIRYQDKSLIDDPDLRAHRWPPHEPPSATGAAEPLQKPTTTSDQKRPPQDSKKQLHSTTAKLEVLSEFFAQLARRVQNDDLGTDYLPVCKEAAMRAYGIQYVEATATSHFPDAKRLARWLRRSLQACPPTKRPKHDELPIALRRWLAESDDDGETSILATLLLSPEECHSGPTALGPDVPVEMHKDRDQRYRVPDKFARALEGFWASLSRPRFVPHLLVAVGCLVLLLFVGLEARNYIGNQRPKTVEKEPAGDDPVGTEGKEKTAIPAAINSQPKEMLFVESVADKIDQIGQEAGRAESAWDSIRILDEGLSKLAPRISSSTDPETIFKIAGLFQLLQFKYDGVSKFDQALVANEEELKYLRIIYNKDASWRPKGVPANLPSPLPIALCRNRYRVAFYEHARRNCCMDSLTRQKIKNAIDEGATILKKAEAPGKNGALLWRELYSVYLANDNVDSADAALDEAYRCIGSPGLAPQLTDWEQNFFADYYLMKAAVLAEKKSCRKALESIDNAKPYLKYLRGDPSGLIGYTYLLVARASTSPDEVKAALKEARTWLENDDHYRHCPWCGYKHVCVVAGMSQFASELDNEELDNEELLVETTFFLDVLKDLRKCGMQPHIPAITRDPFLKPVTDQRTVRDQLGRFELDPKFIPPPGVPAVPSWNMGVPMKRLRFTRLNGDERNAHNIIPQVSPW